MPRKLLPAAGWGGEREQEEGRKGEGESEKGEEGKKQRKGLFHSWRSLVTFF